MDSTRGRNNLSRMFKRREYEFNSDSSDDENEGTTLFVNSRGISNRLRHLSKDLSSLFLYSKKDNKVDTKRDLRHVSELCDLSNSQFIILTDRKGDSEIIWLAEKDIGPTIRLSLLTYSTMEELNFLGNFLKKTKYTIASNIGRDSESSTLLKLISKMANGKHSNKESDKVLFIYKYGDVFFFRFYEQKQNELAESGPRISFKIDLILSGCFSGQTKYSNKTI